MYVGKRPYGLFHRDDVAKVQVEGLDTLENAAGPDCPPPSTADLGKDPIDKYRIDAARAPQLDHIHVS